MTISATCTEAGVKTFTCTVCKTTKTETIPETGHTPVTDPAIAVTCTEDGKTEGSHCSVCGVTLKAQKTVKAAGHQWDDGNVTTPATCIEDGAKTLTCTICGTTKTETIKAVGKHDFGEWDFAQLPNFHEAGEVKRTCKVCGTEETKVVDPVQPDKIQKEKKTGVEIGYLNTTYEGEVQVEVTNVYDGASYNFLNKEKGNFQFQIVDISTVVNGEKTQPSGKVLVKMPIPAEYNRDHLAIYYVAGDGTLEMMDMWIEGDFACFEAEHFSCYALVDESAPKIIPGDVDGDGKLSSADARLALRASVGLTEKGDVTPGSAGYLAADVNGDGKVGSDDARLILRASVGLEDPANWKK